MADETPEQPEEKKPAKPRAAKKPAAKQPAAKSPAEPAPEPEPEEVKAEPFDAQKDAGPTVDMPSPGRASGAATGSAALAATCHLLGLIDFTISVLLIGLIAPLVLWLILKDTDPEIDHHGKESINFQINVLFWWLVALVLTPCLIGIPLLIALPFVEVVLIIIAAVAAAQGQRYRYPAIYRILQ